MYAIREALAAFRRTPLMTVLSATMIGLSLLVAGLFGIVAYNVQRALQRVESRIEIMAYLRDSADPDVVQVLQRDIASFPEVSEVLYISPDQALETARAELGELGPVYDELETNPLPASLDVRLHAGQRDAAAVRAIAERIRAFPAVEDVLYGNDWLDRVYLLRRIAGVATLVLGMAFAAVAMLIIGAAVRMAIFARREEIVVMRLVGATDGYVRSPFLIEGMITGLLGGALALALTFGVYTLLSRLEFRLEWIPLEWVIGGLAAGTVFGILASAISVRRHLREV